MFQNWLSDVKYGLRTLMRAPTFVLIAALTLGLGIGANTAIFSVVYSVLLRPLPFSQPEELVQVWEKNPLKGWDKASAAPANYLDWRSQNSVFKDMGAYSSFGSTTWTGSGDSRQIPVGSATGNLFEMLGVHPVRGRLFVEEETWDDKALVGVLSYGFWLREFGGDDEAIGQKLTLGGSDVEIVGVLPSSFRLNDLDVDVWTPTAWDRSVYGTAVWTRRAHWLSVIARLKPGVSPDEANAEVQVIAQRLEEQYPDTNTQMGAGLTPLREWVVGETRPALILLAAVVGIVLLIACANVANLLLVRGAARAREIAVRNALGAGRRRLTAQLFTESLLLALPGAVIGVLLAWGGVHLLRWLGPDELPRLWEVQVDWTVLGFALLTTLATSLIFGLAPALSASRVNTREALQEGGRQGLGGGRTGGFRRALVVSEVALSVVLLAAGGLLLRSLSELRAVDLGFEPDNLATVALSIPGRSYPNEKATAFWGQLTERVSALPGVESFALTSSIPVGSGTWSGDSAIEGQEEYVREFRHRTVSENYFRTMGTPVLKGRAFEETDRADGKLVCIVNEAYARQIEGRVVGRRIKTSKPSDDDPWMEIVGVAMDEKYQSLALPAPPQIYQPLKQRRTTFMALAMRSQTPPEQIFAAVKSEIKELNASLAPFDFLTMDEMLSASVARERFIMQLVASFALVALIMAAVGVYGVISYSVSHRRQEFGIRLALGARTADVLKLVLSQGLVTVVIGLLLGVPLALFLTRMMSSLLFGISTTDWVTYAGVAATLGVVALVACYVPAMRASQTDPQKTLRAE